MASAFAAFMDSDSSGKSPLSQKQHASTRDRALLIR
jgi:hypothetical protein